MQEQRRNFTIFAGKYLNEYLDEKEHKIRSQIEKESENFILNVNETEYIYRLSRE